VQRRVEEELARLLDVVVERDFPFLGACYGIGVIGTHEGGTVDREFSEPISRVPIALTPDGRADPLLVDLPDEFEAFVGHKEAIQDLPANAVHLASSKACPVQAFRVGRNVYATQFHPELDIHGLCTRIEVYKHAGYFEPHEAETLKQMAREGEVFDPPKILTRFVQRYARA
jgi:GMP synthase (glutamine-hydrolysing)